MQPQINYIKHSEIDKLKWDSCIAGSINRQIYAFSWYLDIAAPGWDALVSGDYLAVMPLPHRKRVGLKYIYVPLFTQQLGVFYSVQCPVIQDFIDAIPSDFRYIQMKLNTKCILQNIPYTENSNYILSLKEPYDSIRKAYNRNCTRNIKKAVDSGFIISEEITTDEFMFFFRNHLKNQMALLTLTDLKVLERLIKQVLEWKLGELACLRDNKGNLHAVGFYMIDNARVVFTICGSTQFGKDNQAMYLLVDSQIKKYAGKAQVYDFFGSNLKGVAYFNSTFGSTTESYKTITLNRLPWFLRLLKK